MKKQRTLQSTDPETVSTPVGPLTTFDCCEPGGFVGSSASTSSGYKDDVFMLFVFVVDYNNAFYCWNLWEVGETQEIVVSESGLM
mmetsp:Transcript_9551/g.15327  ORF Transcript_9551/g.15327 Transcript_9551/m.15327 type:complete len:85 (+) Transcript_9551:920-1174(+)